MAGRVTGGEDDGQRPDPVSFVDEMIDFDGRVLRDVEIERDLQRPGADGAVGAAGDGLGHTVGRNDVGFPLMGIDRRTAQFLEPRESAEVGAVGVGLNEVFDIGRRTADAGQLFQNEARVGIEQRIDDCHALSVVE